MLRGYEAPRAAIRHNRAESSHAMLAIPKKPLKGFMRRQETLLASMRAAGMAWTRRAKAALELRCSKVVSTALEIFGLAQQGVFRARRGLETNFPDLVVLSCWVEAWVGYGS